MPFAVPRLRPVLLLLVPLLLLALPAWRHWQGPLLPVLSDILVLAPLAMMVSLANSLGQMGGGDNCRARRGRARRFRPGGAAPG